MYNKIDFGKVAALQEAGWDMGQVAAEMGMEKETLGMQYQDILKQ